MLERNPVMGDEREQAEAADRAWMRDRVAAAPRPVHRSMVLWTRTTGRGRLDRFRVWCEACGWVGIELSDNAFLQGAAAAHEVTSA